MVAHGDVPGGRLEYSDWPDPTAGPTDVVLQVGAAGVNYTDLLLRRGMIGRLPAIPGIDAAGTVVARGHQVDDIAIGTRVIVNPATSCDRCEYCLSGNHGTCRQRRAIGQALDGSYAQFLRIPRSNVYQIRDDLSLEEAAAMPVAFFTAWQMLMMRAKMRPGECVLIAGAAGGVGSARRCSHYSGGGKRR
jgi:NADPH:quinone reductase-like Zn-dependent oxidoreductase